MNQSGTTTPQKCTVGLFEMYALNPHQSKIGPRHSVPGYWVPMLLPREGGWRIHSKKGPGLLGVSTMFFKAQADNSNRARMKYKPIPPLPDLNRNASLPLMGKTSLGKRNPHSSVMVQSRHHKNAQNSPPTKAAIPSIVHRCLLSAQRVTAAKGAAMIAIKNAQPRCHDVTAITIRTSSHCKLVNAHIGCKQQMICRVLSL